MHEDHLTWDWNKQYLLGFVHAFLGVLKPWCFALLQDLFSLSLHSRRSPVEASALFMLPSHDGAYSISYNIVLVQAPHLSSSWPIERSVSFFHPSSSAVIFSLQVQMCSFTCRLPCHLGLYNYFRGDCVLKDQKKMFVSGLGLFSLFLIKKCHEKAMKMEFIMLIPSPKALLCCGPLLSIKCQAMACTACCADFEMPQL